EAPDVRFPSESGQVRCTGECQLRAISRQLRCTISGPLYRENCTFETLRLVIAAPQRQDFAEKDHLHLMNLRQLKYFVGVLEAGNMKRAADRLHVAQTALGMQIRQLEEDLVVALLMRHSRGVEPTKAGSLLYARALAILKEVEETRKDVRACEREESEAIRLGITPALMLVCGTEIAMTVREQLPNVFLSIVEAMSHVLTETLARGEADFILCYDVPNLPQFARTALLQDDL